MSYKESVDYKDVLDVAGTDTGLGGIKYVGARSNCLHYEFCEPQNYNSNM